MTKKKTEEEKALANKLKSDKMKKSYAKGKNTPNVPEQGVTMKTFRGR